MKHKYGICKKRGIYSDTSFEKGDIFEIIDEDREFYKIRFIHVVLEQDKDYAINDWTYKIDKKELLNCSKLISKSEARLYVL